VLPFAVAGFGIGMVMPVMTSAVMGSVPPGKAGQASGVLSSVRQIGSVLGIAVMGAVLQNRAVTYIQDGVATQLDAAPFQLPAGVEQQIIDAVGSSAVDMGQIQAAGGIGATLPSGMQEMLAQAPSSVAEQITAFFSRLFSPEFLMAEFARAMRTTYVFSIVLMLIGAGLALLIRNRAQR
jgi:hypothetical protein